MKTLDQPAPLPEPTQPENQAILELAKELGSVGDIDKETGALLFKTSDDAESFKVFCDEQKLPVKIVERPEKEAGAGVRFSIVADVPPPPPKEKGAKKETAPPEKPRAVEQSKEPFKQQFERVLKSRFEHVPRGNFPTALAPFTSITFVPHQTADGEHTFSATFFYQSEKGVRKHVSWTILKEGIVSGSIPKELPVTRDEIGKEILRLVEQIDITFWHRVDLDIPEKESEPTGNEPPQREKGLPKEPVLDFERLEALRTLGGHFGFYLERSGLNGYRGTLIQGKNQSIFVLDKEEVDNALFVLPAHKRIPTSSDPTDEEVTEVVKTNLQPILERAGSRTTLATYGKRIFHQGDDWQKRVHEALDRLANE